MKIDDLIKLPYRMPKIYGEYRTEDAKDICINFMEFLIDFIKKNEPFAKNSIRSIENGLEEIEAWEIKEKKKK